MSKISLSICAVVLLAVCLVCGCSNDTNTLAKFPVVVFSDLHFDPLDDPSLFQQLVATDSSQWETVFKTSKKSAPSALGADTNYPLLMLALASIKQNLDGSLLIIYTGDILGHYISSTFFNHYYANLGIPVPTPEAIAADPVAVAAMEAFVDKTVAFVMGQVRSAVGNIPVMFAVGNSDSYLGALPEPSFLSNTAELYYTKFLNGITDRQAFMATFKQGGYYSVDVPGTNLMVIGLNTDLCALPGTSQIIADQLDWLDSRLGAAGVAGKKVWLLMHVPLGADIDSTANANTSGHIPSLADAKMMWQPEIGFQASFLNILSKHPGVVTMTLAAHTHMDEFRILSPSDVLEITPAISPYFGNYPAFKIFTLSQDTLRPTDYITLNYDLAAMPESGQFTAYYMFSTAYSMQGYLNDSRSRLYQALVADSSKQTFYKEHYYSGNLLPPPPSTQHSQISTATWPIFWSGIGNVGQQEFFDSVNSYQ